MSVAVYGGRGGGGVDDDDDDDVAEVSLGLLRMLARLSVERARARRVMTDRNAIDIYCGHAVVY